MRLPRYFDVRMLPVAKKCIFCPIPKVLRPWEVCPCPFLNTRPCIIDRKLAVSKRTKFSK